MKMQHLLFGTQGKFKRDEIFWEFVLSLYGLIHSIQLISLTTALITSSTLISMGLLPKLFTVTEVFLCLILIGVCLWVVYLNMMYRMRVAVHDVWVFHQSLFELVLAGFVFVFLCLVAEPLWPHPGVMIIAGAHFIYFVLALANMHYFRKVYYLYPVYKLKCSTKRIIFFEPEVFTQVGAITNMTSSDQESCSSESPIVEIRTAQQPRSIPRVTFRSNIPQIIEVSSSDESVSTMDVDNLIPQGGSGEDVPDDDSANPGVTNGEDASNLNVATEGSTLQRRPTPEVCEEEAAENNAVSNVKKDIILSGIKKD